MQVCTSGRRLKHGNRRYLVTFILYMYIRSFKAHHLGRTQFLPLHHLYPPLLLQFEKDGVYSQFLCPAMGYDVLYRDVAACGCQVTEDLEGGLVFVVHMGKTEKYPCCL